MSRATTSLHTLRSRFRLIYAAAAIISLIMIVGAGLSIYKVTTTYGVLSTIIEPYKFHLLSFNSEVAQLAAYKQAYVSTGNATAKESYDYTSKRLKKRIGTLGTYADTLQDAQLRVSVDELSVELTKLLAASDRLESATAEDQALILSEQLMPAMARCSQLTKDMNTYLFEKHLGGFTLFMDWLDSIKLLALGAFIVLMAGFYYIVHITRNFIRSQILQLELELGELAKGNLPQALPDPKNELSPITHSINTLLEQLRGVKEFSLHVGRGDFESDITVFDNQGDLGNALAGMRQSLKEVSAEDKKRDWVNQGLARFLGIIRDYSGKTEELSYQVLANLIKYVGANQGGIFIVEDEGGQTQLRLEASFAYNRKKYQTKVLQPGQGLVGQAYLERDRIYLKQVPASYVHITSGLGEATPRTLYIQPLMVNEEVMGVLELASFQDFEPHVQDFIQKVSESVASAIGTAQNGRRNQLILEQSQTLAEQLRAQEEELRQNTEELQATQEEMQRRLRELETENAQLRKATQA
ncbi:GAF domain-containing protein [Cesiribacter andamanensis]|uniref:Putative periplasmic ligand-binding sensor domain protein n=1 Tax=Cesiribacter andamanensis AMV16 TaxID=1279009 RepID=M7NS98_9BACT|nr:GAF domain-containing protein [Cesiribacter andamanensis]EMR01339.1 putative periplasmic ligand-binding sensor domain protein [Cesiribacter andamanensis AMV16]